jgi:S-methylmethionine-dependent homocysteine/selenocysteine methylase
MLPQDSNFVRLLRRDQSLLLDGGLATQLEAQGCDIGNELWSASMLQTNPEAIVEAHHAYLAAGASAWRRPVIRRAVKVLRSREYHMVMRMR